MEESGGDRLVSEFNEAKFQIFRLHNTWVETKNLREQGKLLQVKWKLDSAAIELWTDAERLDEEKKEEKNKWVVRLQKIDDDINKAISNKSLKEVYFSLLEKEKLLRSLQNAAGKGAKYRPDDYDDM